MEYILCGLLAVVALLCLLILSRTGKDTGTAEKLAALQALLDQLGREQEQFKGRQDLLVKTLENSMNQLAQQNADHAARQDRQIETFRTGMADTIGRFQTASTQQMDSFRRGMSESMEKMEASNKQQLDSIRKTVDDQLQDALEKKLTESFRQVSERLEQVYKGLGEMQTVAASVGDLKKVLSNVKTRGILGEIQLGAILEQILSPEQYLENVATKKGSADRVEFAVRLPGDDGKPVLLPIDAKFPVDAYAQLLEAYDAADAAQVEAASKLLRDRVLRFAKDIHDKYISPPDTTDFGIMFVPVEGLYAELVRIGMIEELQRKYRVSLTGPTTMGALLNSLQMGFKTLAIQTRSSEVWNVLGKVKTEFDTFGTVLAKTQERITQANQELDKLVGTRTRKIQSALKNVEALPVGDNDPVFLPSGGEEPYV